MLAEMLAEEGKHTLPGILGSFHFERCALAVKKGVLGVLVKLDIVGDFALLEHGIQLTRARRR